MLAHSVFLSLPGSASLLLHFTFDQSSALELNEAGGGGVRGEDGSAEPSPCGPSPNPPLAGCPGVVLAYRLCVPEGGGRGDG